MLVGAGPGDLKLMTIKGMEAIREADVILYDRLINPMLLGSAKDGCELIYCGKLPNRHTLRQEAINSLLVEKALEGKTVLRLKGGDPAVFGRVGEEAQELVENGIEFEIVPGITSGIAAPLYAGIPVTHRNFGESFAIVTAHDKSANGEPLLDWASLANGIDTIAFYMGVRNLPYICTNLIKHGKSPQTPVILIQWGTFSRQKTLEGTLETIAEKVKQANFSNPAITLVGDIVKMREKINWFEKKPLFGRQILLASAETCESKIADEMRQLGADVIEFPKMKTRRFPLNEEIQCQLNDINYYDEILFKSPESVGYFFEMLLEASLDIRKIRATLFGVSKKSISALRNHGLLAHPVQAMAGNGKRLVIGEKTSVKRMDELYGDFLFTHERIMDDNFLPILGRMLDEVDVDTIIFPDRLSVRVFSDCLEKMDIPYMEFIKGKRLLCMGQKSMTTAKETDLSNIEMIEEGSPEMIIESLLKVTYQ